MTQLGISYIMVLVDQGEASLNELSNLEIENK